MDGPDASRDARIARVLANTADVIAATLLGALVIGRMFYRDLGMRPEFGWDRMAVIVIAIALLGVRRWVTQSNINVVLATMVSLTVAAMALLVVPATGTDLNGAIRQALIRVIYRGHAPSRIVSLDDRYGYVLVPNSEDFERTADFSATYSIDSSGNRVTPASSDPAAPPVVFLGDSFTFGTGVENADTFASRLASGPWRSTPVLNMGVGGWGLTQMYLRLLDLFEKGLVPKAVFVTVIANDLSRSDLRPPLVRGLKQRLEFVDGAFVPSVLVDGDRRVEPPELRTREVQIADDILIRMNKACQERNVGFAVILLFTDPFPSEFVYELGQAHVALLDLTTLRLPIFPHNYHPNAEGHRLIADAIANSFLNRMAVGDAVGR